MYCNVRLWCVLGKILNQSKWIKQDRYSSLRRVFLNGIVNILPVQSTSVYRRKVLQTERRKIQMALKLCLKVCDKTTIRARL